MSVEIAIRPRSSRRTARQRTARIFAVPALLFLVTCAGLVLGLTGDGLPDLAAWLLLSLPILAVLRAWRRRS